MARVTGPDGKQFEEISPGALAYYRREPGYKVAEDEPVITNVQVVDDEPQIPAKSAPKADWLAYARSQGYDGADDELTVAELQDTYGG